MSWVLTFLGISALVLLHEAGHFAAAKAVGMRVERFSLFFGPLIVKVKRGETEYGIGPIPLGGYVKISGMNPREPLPAGEEHRGYYRQPVWKRLVVIGAGPAMNVLIAFVILAGVYTWSAQHVVSNKAQVAAVEAGMPASGVLHKGDVLIAVEGRPVSVHDDELSFINQIAAHHCAGKQVSGCSASTPVHLTVLRGSQKLHLSITPRYNAKEHRALIGFRPEFVLRSDTLPEALGASVSQMWNVTSETVSRIGQIFTSAQDRKQLHGIVGTSDVVSQAFSFSFADAMYVLALISLSLAIVNLFPFLPLDGGHLFWAVAEKVRGHAISFAVMERASVVGFALVMVIFAIGLSNDVHSLSNGGLTLQH